VEQGIVLVDGIGKEIDEHKEKLRKAKKNEDKKIKYSNCY
jgi:hypothetical protein